MRATTSVCVFSAEEWSDLKRDLLLSHRQADVVEQLLMGHSDKQIAYNLQMSMSSVRTHLSKVFLRLGVRDRCELLVHLFAHSREQRTRRLLVSPFLTMVELPNCEEPGKSL